MSTAEEVVVGLQPLRLHGFGVKLGGIGRFGYALASSDSMAWSYGGRMGKPNLHPEETKKSCANCLVYARRWRDRVLSAIDRPQQTAFAHRLRDTGEDGG